MGVRATIADIAAKAGVSVSTVDRVLNGRAPVSQATAERVTAAADAVGYHGTALIRWRLREMIPQRRLGFVLQQQEKPFYRELAAELERAVAREKRVRGEMKIAFVDEVEPHPAVDAMRQLGGVVDALAVVAVDHAAIAAEIHRLAGAGVPAFALLTDLAAPSKAGSIAIDGYRAGRQAAWAIGRLARRAGRVGALVGSHRYRGHEDREAGFRSYFREHAPAFEIRDAASYLDRADLAYEVTLDLLRREPDLVGLHVVGGGTVGTLRALREERTAGEVVVACHELGPETRQALAEGWLDMIVAPSTRRIAELAVETMIDTTLDMPPNGGRAPRNVVVPHDILIQESV